MQGSINTQNNADSNGKEGPTLLKEGFAEPCATVLLSWKRLLQKNSCQYSASTLVIDKTLRAAGVRSGRLMTPDGQNFSMINIIMLGGHNMA